MAAPSTAPLSIVATLSGICQNMATTCCTGWNCCSSGSSTSPGGSTVPAGTTTTEMNSLKGYVPKEVFDQIPKDQPQVLRKHKEVASILRTALMQQHLVMATDTSFVPPFSLSDVVTFDVNVLEEDLNKVFGVVGDQLSTIAEEIQNNLVRASGASENLATRLTSCMRKRPLEVTTQAIWDEFVGVCVRAHSLSPKTDAIGKFKTADNDFEQFANTTAKVDDVSLERWNQFVPKTMLDPQAVA